MSRLLNHRALVTGASGGVGRALAVRLAEAGVDTVLLARRREPLEETAELVHRTGRKAILIVGDVTDPADRQRALTAAAEQLGGLDMLINNAGVGAHGRFHEAAPNRLRSIFEVNLFAAMELTREAVPLLREGRDPCVANVGSILAWRGAPFVSEYAASKFALRGWSEAIRSEFAKLGIHVLHSSPSTIASEFRANLLERAEQVPWGNRGGVSPERVADRVVRGIERRQKEVAILWEDWLFVRLARFAPWVLDWKLGRYG